MMALISSAAHLKICSCGLHGHIVTASGRKGPEVFSKQMALEMVKTGVEFQLITKDETFELKHQIEESSLPTNDAEARPTMILHATDITFKRWQEMENNPDEKKDRLLH